MEMLYCDIKFEAKKAIKSQALADFIAEWVEKQQPIHIYSAHWTMFFDGSKMLNGSGAGVVIISPKGDKLKYVLKIHFDSSNNEAEWVEQQQLTHIYSAHWTMFFDGSKMLNGSGAGVVIISPKGDKLKYVLQIHFDSSNNEAEYEALLYGLRMAISLGVRRLMVYGDSDLVVNQVMKEWDVRNPAMTTYCNAVRKLEKKFEGLELHHVPRLQQRGRV